MINADNPRVRVRFPIRKKKLDIIEPTETGWISKKKAVKRKRKKSTKATNKKTKLQAISKQDLSKKRISSLRSFSQNSDVIDILDDSDDESIEISVFKKKSTASSLTVTGNKTKGRHDIFNDSESSIES